MGRGPETLSIMKSTEILLSATIDLHFNQNLGLLKKSSRGLM